MLKKELKIAIRAAIKAGEEVIKVYESSDLNYDLKDDNSPLTLADKNANEVINFHLLKTDIPIISEENKQIDYNIRKNWTRCWIVDPLDGTKEFIKRNGEFTVNIALVDNGVPVLGVIYVPVEKTLYYTNIQEGGSFRYKLVENTVDIDFILEKAEPIKVTNKESNFIRVVGSRSHMNQETQDFIDSIVTNDKEVKVLSSGSSLKFCLVAEGNADVYPRFAPTMEWDTAAAHAICNASGVLVKKVGTNEELKYNKENLLNPWFICKPEEN